MTLKSLYDSVAWDHAGSVVGEKPEKRGEIGKIAVSEASLVVGRTTAWLASLTSNFFFLPTLSFFSFSPNAEPGPKLRGWLYLQGFHCICCQYREWYLHKNGTVLSVTIIIAFNFLQAYLIGWVEEGVGICNGLGWNVAMLLCKTGAVSKQ